MDKCNEHIGCDVIDCEYNVCGRNCARDRIKVSCGKDGCTRCDDYLNKY